MKNHEYIQDLPVLTINFNRFFCQKSVKFVVSIQSNVKTNVTY